MRLVCVGHDLTRRRGDAEIDNKLCIFVILLYTLYHGYSIISIKDNLSARADASKLGSLSLSR